MYIQTLHLRLIGYANVTTLQILVNLYQTYRNISLTELATNDK